MKGNRHAKAWAGVCVAGLALTSAGCFGGYHDLVDPCYPERYACKAREAVQNAGTMQAYNGLVLEQTLYNHYFEDGKDTLLDNGKRLLNRISRRRPQAEPVVFVQNAHDDAITPRDPREYASYAGKQAELNEKRRQSVKAYLTAIKPTVDWQVVTHEAGRTGIDNRETDTMLRSLHTSARGSFVISGFNQQ